LFSIVQINWRRLEISSFGLIKTYRWERSSCSLRERERCFFDLLDGSCIWQEKLANTGAQEPASNKMRVFLSVRLSSFSKLKPAIHNSWHGRRWPLLLMILLITRLVFNCSVRNWYVPGKQCVIREIGESEWFVLPTGQAFFLHSFL